MPANRFSPGTKFPSQQRKLVVRARKASNESAPRHREGFGLNVTAVPLSIKRWKIVKWPQRPVPKSYSLNCKNQELQ